MYTIDQATLKKMCFLSSGRPKLWPVGRLENLLFFFYVFFFFWGGGGRGGGCKKIIIKNIILDIPFSKSVEFNLLNLELLFFVLTIS